MFPSGWQNKSGWAGWRSPIGCHVTVIHCFYWSSLHFVSTHIAEGGASQNFGQNGIFSSAEIHEREPSGLFLLEGTRMTDLMLRLTLSYLSRGRKINCTHRREPPTYTVNVHCTEGRNHGNLNQLQSMLKPLQLIGKVTKLIWPRTDWNVFSETHTDSNRFQEKGSTNSKESKKYQNRSNHMQTDLNRIFSKPVQFQVEQGNIGWTFPLRLKQHGFNLNFKRTN